MSTAAAPSMFEPRLKRRRRTSGTFRIACIVVTCSAMIVLAGLLVFVIIEGWPMLTPKIVTKMPSTLQPESGGMNSAIWGSIWILLLTGMFAVPTGVGAAVYLEEYARDNRFTRFIKLNIANLAGVPSIVYGILGLALFVRWMRFDRSVVSGALTLGLLVLPVIIIASREAIAAVPQSLRRAAYALGATRWQTIRHHVLPAATPGIMTGVILSLSRAIGETAPLIMIGAMTRVAFIPGGSFFEEYPQTPGGLWEWLITALTDQFTAMPIQIYDWASRPQTEFHELAAAGIVVLLAILLTMNAAAVGIRAWHQRNRT